MPLRNVNLFPRTGGFPRAILRRNPYGKPMKTLTRVVFPFSPRRLIVGCLIGSMLAAFSIPTPSEAITKKKAAKKVAKKALSPAAAAALRARSVGKGVVVGPNALLPIEVPPPPSTLPAPLTGSSADMVNFARPALTKANTTEERAAIWLSIYAAAGIPVLDESGRGIGTGSIDPIGPPWWMVWSMAAARTDQGISLNDLARAMSSRNPEAAKAAVDAMAKDLRMQHVSPTSKTSSFVAHFVAQRFLSTSKGIRDDSFDPATTRIDMATAQFLLWATIRGSLASMAKSGLVKAPANIATTFYQTNVLAQAASDTPGLQPKKCSELFGTEQGTFWTNFLLNKFLISGVSLPGGIDLPTWTSNLGNLLDSPEDAINGTVGKFERSAKSVASSLGKVNAVFSILSFILQYSGISLAGVAPELERTKTRTDGAAITAEVEIWYSLPKAMKGIPDGASKLGCAFNTLSNALGAGATLPSEGPMGGVEVVVGPGKGFGRMMFNFINFRQTADENGHVDVPLIGRAQTKKIPNPVPVKYVWSIRVHSTTDPVDGAALFNFFFDSFTAVGTVNPLAGIGAVVDFVKLTPVDLGELEGPLIDWEDGEEPCTVKGGNFLISPKFC
jgi:hypothetical protein